MSDIMTELEEDWQSYKSIVECNRHMWTTKEAADVTFSVGEEQEKIKAHKYVLISRSRVFHAMFVGPVSGNTGEEVVIPDIDPDTFKSLLMFLYCDEVKVDLNNVLALLYSAKKYSVQSLIDKCLNKLKSNMVFANVCVVMETAHTYGHDELVSRCKSLILQNPQEVFNSETFTELCSDCLEKIISDDSLSMKEEKVFEAVLKFSEEKCRQQGLEATPENRRRVLGDVVKAIRFPLMDHRFFADEVEPSGVLTMTESVALMKNFLKRDGEFRGFNSTPRRLLSVVERFNVMGAGWGYKRDKVDAISFTCSKDILIRGLHIYGSRETPCTYEIRMRLLQEPYRAIMGQKRVFLETDGFQKMYPFLLDNPVKVEKDKLYTFELSIRGHESFSGEQGAEVIEKDGVTFKFSNTDKSTNNTTVSRGQLPGIVFEEVPVENTPL